MSRSHRSAIMRSTTILAYCHPSITSAIILTHWSTHSYHSRFVLRAGSVLLRIQPDYAAPTFISLRLCLDLHIGVLNVIYFTSCILLLVVVHTLSPNAMGTSVYGTSTIYFCIRHASHTDVLDLFVICFSTTLFHSSMSLIMSSIHRVCGLQFFVSGLIDLYCTVIYLRSSVSLLMSSMDHIRLLATPWSIHSQCIHFSL